MWKTSKVCVLVEDGSAAVVSVQADDATCGGRDGTIRMLAASGLVLLGAGHAKRWRNLSSVRLSLVCRLRRAEMRQGRSIVADALLPGRRAVERQERRLPIILIRKRLCRLL